MASAIASSASRALVSPASAAVVQRQSASKQFCMPIACRPSSIADSRPAGVRCQASSEQNEAVHLGRREALIAGLAGLAAVGAVAPPEAHADQLEEYKEDTKSIIGQIRTALDLDKKDPAKPDAVNSLLENSTAWVAKYRRERAVAGKSSYGNVYSAVNAVAGHYNNFGPTYPLPAKRKDRIFEELIDAEKQLARGR
eukprot:TRINITY_DN16675_c0_g1_i1.p1 TRINITY_DN16675_c0_g1~~TRINITY_DN16675_c0_g1_i1.p1  ORF type:complete len:197 (-),score=28.32 TRINITY_DN16675_c0_g1_i1:252-842(-)